MAKGKHSKKKIATHDAENCSPQTIEEYNKEIVKALQSIQKGNFTTLEQLETEMQSW